LPIYYITTILALLKESGILPAEIKLDKLSRTFAARTARLDLYYPLWKRAERIHRSNQPTSWFAHRILALLRAERVNPITEPPWTVHEDQNTIQQRISGLIGWNKAQAAKDFLEFLPTIPSSDIQVFLDGSKREGLDRATGARSVTY
jgi:hypothetical protein